MKYETLTVGKLIRQLRTLAKEMQGDNTPVYSGDFECNYLHGKHEIQTETVNGVKAIVLGYEMHENLYEH